MSVRTPSSTRTASRLREEAPASASRGTVRRPQAATLKAPLSAQKPAASVGRRAATLGPGTAAELSSLMRHHASEMTGDGVAASEPARRKQHVEVTVRIRPLGDGCTNAFASGKAVLRREEGVCTSIAIMDTSGSVSESLRQGAPAPPGTVTKHVMSFDRVLDETVTQAQVFQDVAARMVDDFMGGTNCALLAYGQTGSGKTHTMFGSLEDADARGILPRSLQRIFEMKEEMERDGGWRLALSISCMEIYKDDALDLMPKPGVAAGGRTGASSGFSAMSAEAAAAAAIPGAKLRIRMIGEGTQIDNLQIESISSPHDAMVALHRALSRRVTGSTAANTQSSRSHAVVSIYLEGSRHSGDDSGSSLVTRRKAIFDIVDLAGSERQAHTAAENDRLREAAQINSSLLVLKQIIKGMKDAQMLRSTASRADTMLRWRDSTLTSVLRRSLLGNCSTSIIATVNPDVAFWPETLATLDFALCASKIRTEVSVTDAVSVDHEALTRRNGELEAELRSLSVQLAEARAKANVLASTGTASVPQDAVATSSAPAPSQSVRALRTQLSSAAANVQRWMGQLRLPPAPSVSVDDTSSIADTAIADLSAQLAESRTRNWQLMLQLSRSSLTSVEGELQLVPDDFPPDTLSPSTAGPRVSAGKHPRTSDDAAGLPIKKLHIELAAQGSFRVHRRDSTGAYDDDFAASLLPPRSPEDEFEESGPVAEPPLAQAAAATTARPVSVTTDAATAQSQQALLSQLATVETRVLHLAAALRKSQQAASTNVTTLQEAYNTVCGLVTKLASDMTRADLPDLLLRTATYLEESRIRMQEMEQQRAQLQHGLDDALRTNASLQERLQYVVAEHEKCGQRAPGSDELPAACAVAANAMPPAMAPVTSPQSPNRALAAATDMFTETAEAENPPYAVSVEESAPETSVDVASIGAVAPRQRRLIPLREIIRPSVQDERPIQPRTTITADPYWQPQVPSPRNGDIADENVPEDEIVTFHPRRAGSGVEADCGAEGSQATPVVETQLVESESHANASGAAAPEAPSGKSSTRGAHSRNFLKHLIQRA